MQAKNQASLYPFSIAQRILTHGIGTIYLIAFVSYWLQAEALIGAEGILPQHELLAAAYRKWGSAAYWQLPSLFWFNHSDTFRDLLLLVAISASILTILGYFQRISIFICWLSYLSLTNVGQIFFSYQWDALLHEAGFLAIFLAPLRISLRHAHSTPPSKLIIFLFRFLLFRLIFSSGAVKLLSGDPNWLMLRALDFHYLTQPLPSVLAYYAHQMPAWMQRASVFVMFIIELLLPFFIFGPRKLRIIAGTCFISLQILIAITGSYTFFNLLTICLCLVLFDDQLLGKIIPKPLLGIFFDAERISYRRRTKWAFFVHLPLAAMILVVAGTYLSSMLLGRSVLPAQVYPLVGIVRPFSIVNSYGLFAVMTTKRYEIVLEGSNDLETWLEYEFKYKPGDVRRAPRYAAPHQPRLDWQMWFAALGNLQQNPWFLRFAKQLLEANPKLLKLIARDPFNGTAPHYVRALLYDYTFVSLDEHSSSGNWWRRDYLRVYLPAISLENFGH